MIQLFMALSHPALSEWRFGVLRDGAALSGAEPADLAPMRCHQIDTVKRGVAKPKKMPQLMSKDLFVSQWRAVRFRPCDLNDLGSGEGKRPSFDRFSVHRLYR